MLTDPASHGGDPFDAFDVVAPSLPGVGFSDKPSNQAGCHIWRGRSVARVDDGNAGLPTIRGHAGSLVGVHLTDVPFWHLFQRPDDLSHGEQRFLDVVEK